jgi:hypothetical protein
VSLISQPSQGHRLVMMTTPAKIPPAAASMEGHSTTLPPRRRGCTHSGPEPPDREGDSRLLRFVRRRGLYPFDNSPNTTRSRALITQRPNGTGSDLLRPFAHGDGAGPGARRDPRRPGETGGRPGLRLMMRRWLSFIRCCGAGRDWSWRRRWRRAQD